MTLISKRKTVIYLYVISFFHSLFLLFMTFVILNSSHVHWDEEELVWVNTFLKKFVFGVNEKPKTEEFLFVNVAYDNQLIHKYDKDGFVLGNQDITDRSKLTKFFKAVQQENNHQYIFCDIRFDEKSPQDSLLQKAFATTQNLIASAHNIPPSSLFKIPLALSNYDNDGSFLKFRYIEKKKYKSSPLVMYEKLENVKSQEVMGLLKIEDRYFLNYGIMDLRIRDFDIKKNQTVQDSGAFHMKYMHLGEMLLMDSLLQGNFIKNEVKDRIVVLGDFEDRDLHATVAGNIPGPIILVNAYLALQNGDNELKIGFVIFLFLGYFILSCIIFFSNRFTKDKMGGWFPKLIKFQFILIFLGYFTFLFLLSFLSYLLFNVQISIIVIAVYVKIIDWIVEHFFTAQQLIDKGP